MIGPLGGRAQATRSLGWALTVVGFCALAIGAMVLALALAAPDAPRWILVLEVLGPWVYVGSGLIARWRRPSNRIGLLTPAARLTDVDDHVLVEVCDDGIDGAAIGGGSGLSGLVDRVETLGGRLRVDSPVGHGTTVAAELPRLVSAGLS